MLDYLTSFFSSKPAAPGSYITRLNGLSIGASQLTLSY
jgi:hypothetical protein